MNEQMKNAVLADGIVDKSEAQDLRNDVFADGVVDKQEVRDLFEINDAVSGKANDPAWQVLMVDAVTNYCLEDETSPNVVDQEEGDFLADMIEGDGEVDTIEVAILTTIRDKATAVESERLNALIAAL